jgi:ABC-type nickel/cobalt efflux system permease component RcnA
VRRLFVAALALLALAAPASASAHPLGNFTVNRFARVQVDGDRLYVRYVLDMAEIPTLQAGRIDPDAYARRIAAGVRLRLDGRRAALAPLARRLAHPPGAGGLETTRLEVVLAGPRLDAPVRAQLQDTNFADRIGWKEIVVGARTRSASKELRAYPRDLLRSPLDVTAITATLAPGAGPSTAPGLTQAPAPTRATGGFAGLVHHDLSAGFVLLSLGLALFWGAAHALSPGHGKAIVAGYLVGARGKPRHALLLGAIVTVTHTVGVFALGLVTLALSEFVLPEQLYPWLNLASALLVVGVGLAVARWRLRDVLHARAHARARDQPHHHHHGHGHGHNHGEAGGGMRGLLGAGISGGIVPCPTALVVLLAAVSLHRVGYGLVLIVAFSVGLAATVTGIGLVAVSARRLSSRASFDGPLVRALPAVSAFVVLALGLVMTARAVPSLL